MKVNFTIDGEAKGKERPKFSTQNCRAFTPEQTKNYENWVKLLYRTTVKPDSSTPSTNNDSDEMLSVCIGVFKVREYAEAALKESKEKGFKGAYLMPR